MFHFFASFREANDWLEFDCDGEEAERYSHAWSDQYAEWALLANAWERDHDAKGHDLDGQHGACRT